MLLAMVLVGADWSRIPTLGLELAVLPMMVLPAAESRNIPYAFEITALLARVLLLEDKTAIPS